MSVTVTDGQTERPLANSAVYVRYALKSFLTWESLVEKFDLIISYLYQLAQN